MGKSIYRGAAARSEVRRWCHAELERRHRPTDRSVVSVDGRETHLVTAGAGTATVLFLPGTNFPAAACGPVLDALAARCRVLAPDVPGQPGLSDEERPPVRGRLDWYGRWLTDLLPRVTDRPVTVAGWSMGAAIALSSASPLIERVVLVSPGGIVRLRTPPAVLGASLGWVLRRTEADAERLLRVMHGPGREPRRSLVEWMTIVARCVRSSADPGLARIAVPRREHAAISGDRDRFLPPSRLGPALHRRLGVEPTTVPGAGHLLAEERPEEVARAAVPGP